MADTEVFGILSLLLAAAGALYLLRARLISRNPPQDSPPIDLGDGRAADTLPPVLRPISEIPAKMAAAAKAHSYRLHRDEVVEEKQTASVRPTRIGKATIEVRKPLTDKELAAALKLAKPAAKTEPAKPTTKTEPATPAAKTEPTKPAAKTEPATPDKDAKPAPNAKAASAPAKDAAKPAPAPAKPSGKGPTPTPSKAAPVAPTSSSKNVGKLSEKEKATAAKEEARKKRAAAEADIPKIEVEEDDDVEPTKVGKFERRPISPPVQKLVFDDGADVLPTSERAPLVVFALAQSDPGKRRKQNEDSFLILEEAGLYVVADGMGGHRGGQHASKLAVKTIGDAFTSKSFEAAAHEELPLPASELARAIQMANASIHEEAGRTSALKGMGTTLCAVRFSEDKRRLYVGHVGDSRCYRVRDGSMKQMTSDHTMADYGVAGPEGAHLSRALGVWPTVPIDIIIAEPKLDDVYLLCSDGLTKMLPDGTIATQLLHEDDPKAAVDRLVFFANAHGGKDNITVILLRIVEPGWKPPSSTTV